MLPTAAKLHFKSRCGVIILDRPEPFQPVDECLHGDRMRTGSVTVLEKDLKNGIQLSQQAPRSLGSWRARFSEAIQLDPAVPFVISGLYESSLSQPTNLNGDHGATLVKLSGQLSRRR